MIQHGDHEIERVLAQQIKNHKQRIRTSIRAARVARPSDIRAALGAKLCDQLKAAVLAHSAHTVSCFVSVHGEPDTSIFLSWATTQRINVLLPISEADGTLRWGSHYPGKLQPGRFEVPEPTTATSTQQPQLMFIPAAAASSNGVRLGWGRGYFDKYLSALTTVPPVFAVVYDSEVLSEIPSEPHDYPVQGIITPHQTIQINR